MAFHATFDTIFITVGDLQKNDAHFHFSSVIFILRYPICIFRGVIFILKYLICISHL